MGLTQPREETRMSQQNTGGESNPAHFSVIRISPDPDVDDSTVPVSAKDLLNAALCPLSAHPDDKLMQKIHRLTDN
jgi:hypothetical protein